MRQFAPDDTTGRHIPQRKFLYSNYREDLKSHTFLYREANIPKINSSALKKQAARFLGAVDKFTPEHNF